MELRIGTPPPPEEYSRVTNPERFRPLHSLALEIVSRLQSEYDTVASETFVLVRGVMPPIEWDRPPVTLAPTSKNAAPISFAFTPFPSLILRAGRWFYSSFPSCGCDACAETAEREGDRLKWIINNVVQGNFGEELEQPLFRSPRIKWWFGIDDGLHDFSGGGDWPSGDRARELRAEGAKRIEWQPWPRL